MKKIVIALIVACLLIGAIGVVALPAPVQVASQPATQLAGEFDPPIVPLPFQPFARPSVAWNS